jgi:hypothetical protein
MGSGYSCPRTVARTKCGLRGLGGICKAGGAILRHYSVSAHRGGPTVRIGDDLMLCEQCAMLTGRRKI